MIRPPSLKKGDTIGILSTARKISREELGYAVDIIKNWGLQVRFSPNLFESYHQFSGTDEQRLADLQFFMDDPDIKAILCARGGYGTVRIIDELSFLSFRSFPKWICGYSDVTVLHNKLQSLGIESLHSTMPINFPTNTNDSLESMRKVLFGDELIIETTTHELNRNGEVKGKLIGGNLSILYSQMGSSTALKTEGRILFIEDLDEYLYHVDRMMYNIKRNGYLDELAGVIIGGMNDMNDNTVPFGKSAYEIIAECLRPYNFPVSVGFPAGHIENNQSLIMGRTATLTVGDTVRLQFDHGHS